MMSGDRNGAIHRRNDSRTVSPTGEECVDPTDLQLVRRVRSGDSDALGMLYDRYASTINGLARSILRDHRLAEEATHDVFLNLWQRPDAYDASRGPFAGWLFRVARNRAIDLFRRRREQPFAMAPGNEQGEIVDPAVFLIDPEPDPIDQAISTLQRESVRRGLLQLTADHKHLLELAYFNGMTQSEIAAHLNRPLGTVKTQIRSAMRKLADVMAEASTDRDSSRVDDEDAPNTLDDPQVHLFEDQPGASSRV
jgi:RNA polymerase sigma-70 factor (ECF subfamily)